MKILLKKCAKFVGKFVGWLAASMIVRYIIIERKSCNLGESMKTPKIFVKNDRVLVASIPVYFFKFNKEDKIIIAECPSLAISTNGNSLKHAKEMFEDAFNLWKETVNDNGNIAEVLEELGWKRTDSGMYPKEENHKIPIELLASTSLNLQIPMRNNYLTALNSTNYENF